MMGKICDFFSIFAAFMVVGTILWFLDSAISANQEHIMLETESCEKSGGVYVDNMRRVGKTTSHNYMCMKKDLFIIPEGEK
jgi:Na+/H+ antiporter NhaC